MKDCSNHKKEVAGITDMKILAEMVGDLHYEALQEFVGRLGIKLYRDCISDRAAGRTELGYALLDASEKLTEAGYFISKAWKISKPFMDTTKK
jgi:hypothetical protein